MLNAWLILGIAIVAEVAGSTMLMKTQQFTRLAPTVSTLALYAFAFYCLSFTLKYIPLGIAYSVWAGVGIVLTAMVGVFVYRQALDLAAVVGIGFILVGIVLINTFSKVGH